MAIISFLPVECLDALVTATGYNLDTVLDYEYKYTWLLERIGMLRLDSEAAAIIHDNPEQHQLVALIQQERLWSKGLQNTVAAMQAEYSDLRK
jgi:hypothetical protein